ncbi:spore coat associated protein CotJA [Thalassobacillus hwangdonensis]|uniref:Spore coat associated protein CotJA n=1 Tax=Thalassobacillus hwangdonensis TaxID=546108 RepID=A0ABW3L038_9BACI
MFTTQKCYHPFYSEFDPCPIMKTKCYVTPPNLYVGFQEPGLPQFKPKEALMAGTLWPIFYSEYPKS